MGIAQEVERTEQVLDDLYQNPDDCVSSDTISNRVQTAVLTPSMKSYFADDNLDQDCYTRQELIDHVNEMIKNDGRALSLGLLS